MALPAYLSVSGYSGTSSTASSMTLPRPPIVLERQKDRGPATAVAGPTLAGTMVVQQWPNARQRFLKLRITLLSAAQVDTLRTLINAGGMVTVNLGVGSTIVAVFAEEATQEIVPLLTDYPECDDAGSSLPDGRKVYAATLTLVRV
jgi:hypothetical protein